MDARSNGGIEQPGSVKAPAIKFTGFVFDPAHLKYALRDVEPVGRGSPGRSSLQKRELAASLWHIEEGRIGTDLAPATSARPFFPRAEGGVHAIYPLCQLTPAPLRVVASKRESRGGTPQRGAQAQQFQNLVLQRPAKLVVRADAAAGVKTGTSA
ncbi:hypothetical protein B0G76_1679 [Paraburkholderia sp. BL23I1N1]|uniref:Uncharacterized protein n=1 Tax=Paraburkholderia podalyriae TaxID=1938811 RepID=A0ABR7PU49_9BURK|nr:MULTISPECIES: hypothetical protein [Paraburkholderia]MBC8749805.1 hypothetical protein [Paraburkholderia podalyriae]RKE35572.1 hypothetical protein B0G76_1679 [Paraburkholderia sp. BL23I1N1]